MARLPRQLAAAVLCAAARGYTPPVPGGGLMRAVLAGVIGLLLLGTAQAHAACAKCGSSHSYERRRLAERDRDSDCDCKSGGPCARGWQRLTTEHKEDREAIAHARYQRRERINRIKRDCREACEDSGCDGNCGHANPLRRERCGTGACGCSKCGGTSSVPAHSAKARPGRGCSTCGQGDCGTCQGCHKCKPRKRLDCDCRDPHDYEGDCRCRTCHPREHSGTHFAHDDED
jgi:hypothetical protein